MNFFEALREMAAIALFQDPVFVLALCSLSLAGFSIYAVLAIVKLLINKEG